MDRGWHHNTNQIFAAADRKPVLLLLNEMLRAIGAICLIGVVTGPVVWIADLLGVHTPWITVRQAFLLMLAALFISNAAAILHVVLVSSLPKSQKWHWVHRLTSPFIPFAAFEYLMRSGAPK